MPTGHKTINQSFSKFSGNSSIHSENINCFEIDPALTFFVDTFLLYKINIILYTRRHMRRSSNTHKKIYKPFALACIPLHPHIGQVIISLNYLVNYFEI